MRKIFILSCICINVYNFNSLQASFTELSSSGISNLNRNNSSEDDVVLMQQIEDITKRNDDLENKIKCYHIQIENCMKENEEISKQINELMIEKNEEMKSKDQKDELQRDQIINDLTGEMKKLRSEVTQLRLELQNQKILNKLLSMPVNDDVQQVNNYSVGDIPSPDRSTLSGDNIFYGNCNQFSGMPSAFIPSDQSSSTSHQSSLPPVFPNPFESQKSHQSSLPPVFPNPFETQMPRQSSLPPVFMNPFETQMPHQSSLPPVFPNPFESQKSHQSSLPPVFPNPFETQMPRQSSLPPVFMNPFESQMSWHQPQVQMQFPNQQPQNFFQPSLQYPFATN